MSIMSHQCRFQRIAYELTQTTASLCHVKISHFKIIKKLKNKREISINNRANELSKMHNDICVGDDKIQKSCY